MKTQFTSKTRRLATRWQWGLALLLGSGVATGVQAQNSGSVTTTQSFTYTGQIETWTVPSGVTSLTIEARGAQGSTPRGGQTRNPVAGGKGAVISGVLTVTAGQQLKILVGGNPVPNEKVGGGGSFVVSSTNEPLIIAGGGGGGGNIANPASNGRVTKNGGNGGTGGNNQIGGEGGIDGNGGKTTSRAGGGGGFYTDGAPDNYGVGPSRAFVNGADGVGGVALGNTGPGGGGSGYSGGGGGGGDSFDGGSGGGGGSYNTGANQVNLTDDQGNTGNGLVTIRYQAPPCSSFIVNLGNDGPLTCVKQTVTLATTGGPAGATYTYSPGAVASSTSSATATATNSGPYSVTVTVPGGCSSTAITTVTSNTVAPGAPLIATQSGGPYSADVSSLTISQNTGNVILGVSGCQDGTISWNGGISSTLAVSTANLGTQSFTATCTNNQNGCTSSVGTATVTVVAPTLKVLSRDPDNGQLGNNTIKPYLLLQNAGTTPIPYSSITLRYWLTTENNIPLNFQKNYVAIGQNNLNLRYVPLATPRQGATGYIEYSFNGGAGSLAPNGDSGPLEVQATKQDYSRFVQSDDYSYINNSAFTLNARITAYQNGTIFYGQEPTGTGSSREAAPEAGSQLQVTVLGNPVVGQSVEVEISGVAGQTLQVKLVDLQGKMVHGHTIKEAGPVERVSLPLGNAPGMLLLDVSTASQRQQIKLVRP